MSEAIIVDLRLGSFGREGALIFSLDGGGGDEVHGGRTGVALWS
jgi:hypothetical protein